MFVSCCSLWLFNGVVICFYFNETALSKAKSFIQSMFLESLELQVGSYSEKSKLCTEKQSM